MILQALYQHYQTLFNDPDSGIAPPGYSVAKVNFELLISKEGDLLDIIFLKENNKTGNKTMLVPEQKTRSRGDKAYFLCDNSSYFLGLEKEKSKNKNDKEIKISVNLPRYKLSYELHKSILGSVDNPAAKAIIKFFEKWSPENWENVPLVRDNIKNIITGGNFVFRYDPDYTLVHEIPQIKEAWEKNIQSAEDENIYAQCLITGEQAKVERLHPYIKGVKGANRSGASIVSFNQEAFCSYGKKQSYNSPVSQKAAFGYSTALNYLLASQRNKVLIGETTTVFWAEKKSCCAEEDWLAYLLNPEESVERSDDKNGEDKWLVDPQTVLTIKNAFENVKKGIPLKNLLPSDMLETKFYILGLSPNNARLSIRFWHVDTFGEIAERIMQHYLDMQIEGMDKFPTVTRLLIELAPERKYDNIPRIAEGQIMRAILTGQPYPNSLLTQLILRIRADSDKDNRQLKINMYRAGFIKACLLRKYRAGGNKKMEEVVSVSLNEESTNTAYRLGRLFALLEKAQIKALGSDLNATIKDRYFSSASSTPAAVFPVLLRLSQYHLSKAENSSWLDKLIEKVMSEISDFPAHLSLNEQGLFILGYYHQREALYRNKEEK